MSCWVKEADIAITVSDLNGAIVEMNDKSVDTFQKYGGASLIGQQLNDCHKPHSQKIIADLLTNEKTNIYTIEKGGKKKLIYQAPWYKDGVKSGLVELSLEVPFEMPHFKRD